MTLRDNIGSSLKSAAASLANGILLLSLLGCHTTGERNCGAPGNCVPSCRTENPLTKPDVCGMAPDPWCNGYKGTCWKPMGPHCGGCNCGGPLEGYAGSEIFPGPGMVEASSQPTYAAPTPSEPIAPPVEVQESQPQIQPLPSTNEGIEALPPVGTPRTSNPFRLPSFGGLYWGCGHLTQRMS